ncbi:MAG TPA: isoprenylcysteine carboxylmethyltransferase family protein [Gemmatimonadaceae bacterium]|jgi:protein-S-isoprenylcysteine O-methyltransferase Ste14|nr:isoprenylcysteine carboxylmethyltransferase family protein [Gemmatimonadaceae bacterium]
MLRVLARVVADAMIVAVVLFAAAGTLMWRRAWILVAVLIAVRSLSAVLVYRVNPALLRERATVLVHQHQPLTDRVLLLVFMGTAFVGVPAVAAVDAFHWHLLPQPPIILSAAGLGLFTLGWMIIAIALRTNPFAVTVVRLQDERRHSVVDTGIYGVIRHPMYAGNPLVNVGLALWLGSYAAVLFAAIPLGFLMLRIGLEERFLRRELPGYFEYTVRVPYRLVPGLW